jgi:hypothetical protein
MCVVSVCVVLCHSKKTHNQSNEINLLMTETSLLNPFQFPNSKTWLMAAAGQAMARLGSGHERVGFL